MAVVAALPKGVELRSDEIAATFVVPAPNGCNLDCPFCIVRARGEAKPGEGLLAAQDYVDFLHAAHFRFRIGVVGLQGYEPLLPESWDHSAALLRAAKSLGLKTALVTNGTHLAERVANLVDFDVQGVTVSVDGADAESHDSTRRTAGAFGQTMRGLRAAVASPLGDRLIVTSVLQPGKRSQLDALPALLARLGVRKWVVTPLYKVRKSRAGGLAGTPTQVLDDTLHLQRLARMADVQLLVDDEFDSLSVEASNVVSFAESFLRRLKRLDQALRLSPNGSLSVGQQILRHVGAGVPSWRPDQESAGDFLARVVTERTAARVIPLVRHG